MVSSDKTSSERAVDLTVVEADEADRGWVRDQLRAYNDSQSPQRRDARKPGQGAQRLDVAARDGDGRIVGALLRETLWGWLSLDILWVDAALRGAGLGTRLMAAAEDGARARGCLHSQLSTWDFRARGFYEKGGYRLYRQRDDWPPGHVYYLLSKDWDGGA